MCQNCDILEAERVRVSELLALDPQPCLICQSTDVTAIGTWVAGREHRLAVGDTDHKASVFGFCLCVPHAEETPENEKAIKRVILQEVRQGTPKQV